MLSFDLKVLYRKGGLQGGANKRLEGLERTKEVPHISPSQENEKKKNLHNSLVFKSRKRKSA